jgi:large subunit ribosomal protein L21
MFAIIKTGGKQYRVVPGQSLLVEKLEQEDGTQVSFSEVLCVGTGDQVHLGAPLVENACVTASLVRHVRGEKIIIFKKKRRHNYRRKNGHRQPLSLLKIQDFSLGGQSLLAAQGA